MHVVYTFSKFLCVFGLFFSFCFLLCVCYNVCDQYLGRPLVFFKCDMFLIVCFASFFLVLNIYFLFSLVLFFVFFCGFLSFWCECVYSVLWFVCLFLISLKNVRWNGIQDSWDNLIIMKIFISNLNPIQVGLVVFEVLTIWNEFELPVFIFIPISLELTILSHCIFFSEFFIFSFFILYFSTCLSLRLVGWLFSFFVCCFYFCVFQNVLIVCFSFSFYISLLFHFILQILVCFIEFSCFVKFWCILFFFGLMYVFVCIFVCLQMLINEWIGVLFSILVVLVVFVVGIFLIQDVGSLALNIISINIYYQYCICSLIETINLFQRD